MAERLVRKRNTEKTSAVLPDAAQAGKPETGESAPAGHGRNGAAAFTGAKKVGGTRIVGSQGIRNGLRWRNLWVIWRRSAL